MPTTDAVRSFGAQHQPLLLHSIADSNVGAMGHFWTTATSQEDYHAMGMQLQISYRFDGESPSIQFDPAMANGQAFGAVQVNNSWIDGLWAATGNTSMFKAGAGAPLLQAHPPSVLRSTSS
jgi:hypothetical protein